MKVTKQGIRDLGNSVNGRMPTIDPDCTHEQSIKVQSNIGEDINLCMLCKSYFEEENVLQTKYAQACI